MILTTEMIDPEEASEVLNDPWVYDRISHDFCPESIEFPTDAMYVGGYVDRRLVSVSIVHLFDLGYKFHYQVLREYRRFARELLDQALEFMMPIFRKVYCEIPSLYRSVINFAKKAGFREVSVTEKAFPKNGHWYDRHLLVLEI